MPRFVTVSVVLALAAVGCGRAPAPEIAGEAADDVPLCSDVPPVELPEEHLRDEPIYVDNEQPVGRLSAWAEERDGFEQLWIDRDHLGWVVLAFSEGAEARQAELAEDFPGVGAVVVGVDWTLAELHDLQQRAAEELTSFSSLSANGQKGVVEIGLGALTDERLDDVAERFAGERVCVWGVAPADLPPDGPQPEAGEGWRLLADERVGPSYRTGIAADPDGYARLWVEVGLSGEPPEVDFDTEVVVWFGAVYSGSCPDIRLDDVVVDHDRALVHADITRLDEAEGGVCTSDANPRAYVVALERSRLPAGPFAIQLGPHDPPPGAPEERTLVHADLTKPGAGLSPEEVGPDPSLAQPTRNTVGPGDIVEPGFPSPYRLQLHCGPEWLGPLNDVMWRSDVTETPSAWRDALDPSTEELVVEVLIETDPPILTASANGHEIVYRATAEEPPGCD